jgi:hypothetical protein
LNNRISYVIGLAEDSISHLTYVRSRTAVVNGAYAFFGASEDSTTTQSTSMDNVTLSALAIEQTPTAHGSIQGQIGFHYVQMYQLGDGTNTQTCYGANNQNGLVLSGQF